jgi:hypothetical protein
MILPQDTSFSSDIVTVTDKVTVPTGKSIMVDVTANDVALANKGDLEVTAASVALHGDCTVSEDNMVEYKSKPGFTGWDRCQYTVCVGETCNVGQIGVKVTESGQEAHVDDISSMSGSTTNMANHDAISVTKGEAAYLDVLANDNANGHELSIKSVTHPNFGDTQIVFGRVEYMPFVGYVGLDSFEYTVCDETGSCDSATVDITVTSGAGEVAKLSSGEVFAEDDRVTVKGSDPIKIDVTANDSSPDNKPFVISSVNKAMRGTCEVTSDNQVRYTAPEGFTGMDRCIYLACADNACDKGKIEITVLPPSQVLIPPEKDETESLPKDGFIVAPAEEDKLPPADQDDAPPVDGLVVLPPDNGSIAKLSAASPVQFNQEKVHADDDSVVTPKNSPMLVDVTLNDFVKGMGELIITHAGGSQHGDCVIKGDQVEYSPHKDFIGQDRCGYVVCQDNLCDEGIIRIKVVENETTVMHNKDSSTSSFDGIGILRSGSVQLCLQAGLNHEMRRLRGQFLAHQTIWRHLSMDVKSSCVGSSLVTTAVTPTQTITYTSTYHAKSGSTPLQERSIDLHSKLRSTPLNSYIQQSYVNTEIALEVSADATIMPGFPDQNFGSSQSLLVSGDASKSGRHESILKFDTSFVDTTVCSDGIINAKLSLYSLTSSEKGGTFITTPIEKWTESDVTWNNAPNSNGIVLRSLDRVQAKTYYDIDVSSALTLGRPLSIRIQSGTSADISAQYASRDHGYSKLRPMLRISCMLIDGEESE